MTTLPAATPRSVTRVFVRDLTVEAEIGVYAHERGRRQPLTVEVEVELDSHGGKGRLADTINYETIVAHALAIAGGGHIGLVESYAQRLAEACMAEARVVSARVRVEKPEALAPRTAVPGVEITVFRG